MVYLKPWFNPKHHQKEKKWNKVMIAANWYAGLHSCSSADPLEVLPSLVTMVTAKQETPGLGRGHCL